MVQKQLTTYVILGTFRTIGRAPAVNSLVSRNRCSYGVVGSNRAVAEVGLPSAGFLPITRLDNLQSGEQRRCMAKWVELYYHQ